MKTYLKASFIFFIVWVTGLQAQGPGKMPEKIREIRKSRLIEELKLKDTQKETFARRYDEYLKQRREHNHAKRETLRRLMLMSELESDVPEEKIREAIRELERIEQQIRATQDKMMKDLETLLTPVQIARFIVFEEQFEHRMRELMYRFRERDKKERRHRPPHSPGWPFDDESDKDE